jgi:hypothetical protein
MKAARRLEWHRSSSTNHRFPTHTFQSFETPMLLDILLQHHHPLLIACRVIGLLLKTPLQVLVGVVGREALIEHTEPLSVTRHLLPVALHVLQIRAEVGEAALEDLAVGRRVQYRLDGNELLPRFVGRRENEVRGALACAQEGLDFLGIGLDERIVADVQDAAEAAAPQLGEFVDTQHLDLLARAVLADEPFLEFDHLHVLKADAGVDFARDDGASHVHSDADGLIVGGRHAVVRGQFVELDLAEFADVADLLAFEGGEVGSDAGRGEVDDTGEGLIQEGSDRSHWEATSGGSEGVDHGFEAEIDFAGPDDLSHILQKISTLDDRKLKEVAHTWIVRLQDCNLYALIFEVSLTLGKVQRGVVGRSMPTSHQHRSFPPKRFTHQLVKNVILSVDMMAFAQMKLHLSACQHSGGGASRSSFVLSLELSRSSLNGIISEQAANDPSFLHGTP